MRFLFTFYVSPKPIVELCEISVYIPHFTVKSGEGLTGADGQKIDAQEMLKKLEAEYAAQQNVSLTVIKQQLNR